MILRHALFFSALVVGVSTYPLLDKWGWLDSAAPEAEAPAAATVAKVQPEEKPLAGRAIRLEADQRGHYSSDFTINGRRVEAMIDTGASVVALNRSTAQRVGISVAASDFTHSVATANGTIKAAPINLSRVEIGRIQVRNVQAVVLPDEALAGTLIGMSFLKSVRFSVENDTLVIKQ